MDKVTPADLRDLQRRILHLESQMRMVDDVSVGDLFTRKAYMPPTEDTLPPRPRFLVRHSADFVKPGDTTTLLRFTVSTGSWWRAGVEYVWTKGVVSKIWAPGKYYMVAVLVGDEEDPPGYTLTVELLTAAEFGGLTDPPEDVRVLAVIYADGAAQAEEARIWQRQFSDIYGEAAPTAMSLVVTWDGATCAAEIEAGWVWEPVSFTLVGNVLTVAMESRCVSMYPTPGRCPFEGTLSLSIDPESSASVVFDANGLCNATPGTVFQIGTPEGETISVTVGATGNLTGYVGAVLIGDPATGTTNTYRISSTGRLEA